MTLAETTAENWHVITALVGLIMVKGLDYVQAFLKDRRERLVDKEQTEIQRDTANNIRVIRDGQIAQNGKLSTVADAAAAVNEINKIYHDELLRALREMRDNMPCNAAKSISPAIPPADKEKDKTK